MRSGHPFRLLLIALFGLVAGCATLSAQTTIVINGPTRVWNATTQKYEYPTWKPILGMPGGSQTDSNGFLVEPSNDQQTGQTDSDFVGSSGTPGFFIQAGLINGVEHLAFRIIMNTAQSGNNLNIRLGMDGGALDGKIDLYLGPIISGGTAQSIFFQAPGTSANISPSTSSWGNNFYPTNNRTGLPPLASGGGLAINPTGFPNFNVTSLTTGSSAYPGWTQQGTDADSMISFAIPIADINAALAQVGAGYQISTTSLMRWVAVTSTQSNSVNQDAYGLPKITNSNGVGNITYATFTQIMNPQGQPIPEPSAYGALLGAGLGGLFLLRRRHRAA